MKRLSLITGRIIRMSVLGIVLVNLSLTLEAQVKSWTDTDKKQLIAQYKRTQNEINQETSGLSKVQWNFHEGAGKWSIAEVLEHLNMWQLVTLDQVRYAHWFGPRPELAAKTASDSANTSFIYEMNPHKSPDFTIPTGLVPDVNNLKIFNLKCDEIVRGIEQNSENFRLLIREGKDGYHRDLVQMYIIQYGHVDRHLRQIRRIKSDSKFPK